MDGQAAVKTHWLALEACVVHILYTRTVTELKTMLTCGLPGIPAAVTAL